jgi:type II secretory pathway pseudopilin PulG
MKRRQPNTRASTANSGGYTYLGVLFLIAASGILLVATSQVWYTAQKRDKEEELLFVGDQLRRAIGAYYESTASGPKRYPATLEDLQRDPRSPGVRRYLRQLYRDPMTGGTTWGLMKAADGTIFGVYSLSEQEPLKKGGFGRQDQAFEEKAKYAEWLFMYRPGQGYTLPPLKH